METAYRTFSDSEREARDWFVSSHVQNDCEGCEERYELDGYTTWTPAQGCPVHGEHCEPWWETLNELLDRRWPGTWHDA